TDLTRFGIALHYNQTYLSSFLPFTVKQRAAVFRRRELIYYILLFVSTPKVIFSQIFLNFFLPLKQAQPQHFSASHKKKKKNKHPTTNVMECKG
ncbi:MAG: hypothetical protein J6Y16_06145, partial [Treponema sp.]|nr:hypothetical protein [Treponema sp.]